MLPSHRINRRSKQTGTTLVVAMMLLILIMMMGVTAMVSSDTQYKLSGNLQFEETALNNAEAAINTAEQWVTTNYLDAGFINYNSGSTPEIHPIGHMALSNYDPLTMTWSDSNSKMIGDESKRYYIELISKNARLLGSDFSIGGRKSTTCNSVNTYLITARGTSSRGSTRFVQSYYGTPSSNC